MQQAGQREGKRQASDLPTPESRQAGRAGKLNGGAMPHLQQPAPRMAYCTSSRHVTRLPVKVGAEALNSTFVSSFGVGFDEVTTPTMGLPLM